MHLDIDATVPRVITSDRKKIYRILLNLLGNAIKFTHSGRITIQVKCLNKTKSRVHLQFGVADTGIGIPKEAQAQVFERFFRVTPTSTGYGLGLHIAQSYITLLGGQITLSSEEGVGTTFFFDVECNYKAETSTLPPPTESSTSTTALAPMRIAERATQARYNKTPHLLLVEDNIIALKVLETMVANLGYVFTSVIDGEKAFKLAVTDTFDLILTDLGLSDISGNELATRIRRWEKTNGKKPIPIVGLTGHAKEKVITECVIYKAS